MTIEDEYGCVWELDDREFWVAYEQAFARHCRVSGVRCEPVAAGEPHGVTFNLVAEDPKP